MYSSPASFLIKNSLTMKIRDNFLERYTQDIITTALPNVLPYEDGNTLSNVALRKKQTNRNKLFHDLESPYLTYKGNPHITELAVHAPMYKLDARIECKSMSILSNMTKTVLDELHYVKELPELLFCLVLGNELLNPIFTRVLLNRIKELELQRKVWYGSAPELGRLIDKYKGVK